MKTSWTKLGEVNGKAEWGIRCEGADGVGLSGQEVSVTNRKGATAQITLGAQRESWASRGTQMTTYEVVRAPKNGSQGEGERQPLENRTGKTYVVTVTVLEVADDPIVRKQWALPIASTDPKLWRETGRDIVRLAMGEYALLDSSDGDPPPEPRKTSPKRTPARPSGSAGKTSKRSTTKRTTTKRGG